VVWALAGAEPGAGGPDGGSDLLAGNAEPDIDQPGEDGQPAGDGDPADGGGLADGSDVGSEGSGDGQSNRPPVIDSAGLSSSGLTLTIDPEVSDLDGDDVTVAFDVNGIPVDLEQACFAHDACQVPLDVADVGYQSDADVTIIATDSRGAETRETYSHTVSARTFVRVARLRYTIDNPSACFREVESRELSFRLVSTGAVVADIDRSRTIFSSSAAGPLDNDLFSDELVGEPPPPVEVSLSVTLEGIGTSGFPRPRSYTSDAEETLSLGPGTTCEGSVTYKVEFLVS
jgi:hypothetical protein